MRVGVLGAGGALGTLIVQTLAGAPQDHEVVGIARTRPTTWATSVQHHHHDHSHDGPTVLVSLLQGLEALIVTAPLRDVRLHREALRAGCDVIDVNVQAELNDAIRALDPEARDVQRRVPGMAGAAPGLTGVLAKHVIDRAAGRATTVDVCLLQSAAGTAGRQGTIEMLDLLTARGVAYRDRIVIHPDRPVPVTMSTFDLRNAEPAALELEPALSLATTFDGPVLDRAMRTLTRLRSVLPAAYHPVVAGVARHKAKATGGDERAVLSAVAIDAHGDVLAARSLQLASNYLTTAAVACAAATSTSRAGAGHIAEFLTIEQLLAEPMFAATVLQDVTA